ncbi:MAG: alpha/beta fold hydrolase [Burkholderiaceae bacterium]
MGAGSPAAQPATLVLIHGLFSSPAEFGLLSRILRARGIAFEFLEIPGYTNADRTRPSSWRQWVDAADAALDARFATGTSIAIGGLCVGGMIAAALAIRPRPQTVVGLALMSPTFEYDGWSIGRWQRWRKLAYLLRIDRWMTVREQAPFGIKNLKTREWVMQELAGAGASAAGPAKLPLRGIREAERLCAWVRKNFAAIRVPLLVLHAREDEIASLASVDRVLATATATATTRRVVLEHSFHMITIDNDRQRVAHELADFATASARFRSPDRLDVTQCRVAS